MKQKRNNTVRYIRKNNKNIKKAGKHNMLSNFIGNAFYKRLKIKNLSYPKQYSIF